MWQDILPLVEVVVISIILVHFESLEVFMIVAKATRTFARSKSGAAGDHEVIVDVAVIGHPPALIASHNVARGNIVVDEDSVEHGEKKRAEVSYPRN